MAVGVVVGRVVSADWEEKGVIEVDGKSLTVMNARNRFSSRYEGIWSEERQREDIAAFAQGAVQRAVQGFNAAVLLYGPTGSGKTKVLVGKSASERHNCLSWQCTQALFALVQDSKRTYAVTVSALLVYKEKIYDLLQPQGLATPLSLKESTESGLYIAGLAAFPVSSAEEAVPHLTSAIDSACQAPYPACACSTLFRFHLTSQSASKRGCFRSISLDLGEIAGSERSFKGEKTADKYSLHLSITHLNKVISTLANTGKLAVSLFRGATLPRLLQSAVIGGFPCFLVTVSPANYHIEETIYALKFADAAKKVPLRLQKSSISVQDLAFVRSLQREVATLREFLASKGQETAWEDPFASIGQCLSVQELEVLMKQRTNLRKSLAEAELICQFAVKAREEDLSFTRESHSSMVACTAPVSRLGTASFREVPQTALSPSALLAELELELSSDSRPCFGDLPRRGDMSSASTALSREVTQSPMMLREEVGRDGSLPPSAHFLAASQHYITPRLPTTTLASFSTFDQQLIQQKLRRDNARNEVLSSHRRTRSVFRHSEDTEQEGLQDRVDSGLKRMEEERKQHQLELDQRLEREQQEAMSLRRKLNRRPEIEPRGVRPKGSFVAQLLDS